jgi:hypothetical protein
MAGMTAPALHMMAKPAGAVSNLDCTDFLPLGTEDLYPGSAFRMPDEPMTVTADLPRQGSQDPTRSVLAGRRGAIHE